MSELEVRQARMDVEKSAAELESALDRLHEQIDGGIEMARELREKVKVPTELPRKYFDEFIDNAVAYAERSAHGLFRDLRASVEDEIQKLEKRPLAPLATAAAAGLVLGFFLARSSRFSSISSSTSTSTSGDDERQNAVLF